PVAVYQRSKLHHAVVRPPLNSVRQGNLREDVARISQDIAKSFEELILLEPEQWHLMSPNWPSDHEAVKNIMGKVNLRKGNS
ncbi:MAG: hypothetical protein VXV73_04385, partial [Actinomycetota bacterium]|nr:hypothetical protein [Actinomycetota bacterium]